MTIKASEIARLRKATNAGIMDCREALTVSKGDFDKAKKHLLKKGLARAAKKKDRDTKAGIVHAYIHSGGQVGALVHLACETDFVARTEEFRKLANELGMQIASMNPKDTKELLLQDYIRENSKKVKDLVDEVIAKVGENITVVGFYRLQV
jgi:elongation factor Ts